MPKFQRKNGPALHYELDDFTDPWKNAPYIMRTAATRLAGLGIPQEDVAAILNHVRRDVTGRVYDLYRREKEKRQALSLWSSTIAHPYDLPRSIFCRGGRPHILRGGYD
jgi:integrase